MEERGLFIERVLGITTQLQSLKCIVHGTPSHVYQIEKKKLKMACTTTSSAVHMGHYLFLELSDLPN